MNNDECKKIIITNISCLGESDLRFLKQISSLLRKYLRDKGKA